MPYYVILFEVYVGALIVGNSHVRDVPALLPKGTCFMRLVAAFIAESFRIATSACNLCRDVKRFGVTAIPPKVDALIQTPRRSSPDVLEAAEFE